MAGSKTASEIAYKTEYEVKYYNFDFDAELEDGEAISGTPTATVSPSGLTLATPSVSDSVVQVKATGGTASTEYLIKIQLETDAGESIEGSGWLHVTED